MNRTAHPVEPEEVMAYFDGELAGARAADVAAHLEQCGECRALTGELRLVSEQAAAWQVEPAPQRLTERVTTALEEQAAPRTEPQAVEPPQRSRAGRWVLGLAGGFAIFLLVLAISIPNLLRSRMAADEAFRVARARQEAALLAGTPHPPRAPAYSPPERFYAEQAPHLSALRGRVKAADVEQVTAPMIIRSASLVVVTKEFENARAAMELTVRQLQGYIAHLSLSGHSGAGRALTATLRVPADKLDAALAELKKLGRVEQESQGGQEVTEQYVDLVARISNASNTEQRLIQVLRERTGKVADILAVEKEIARVREEIERMEAQRKNLETQVGFATLQVRLNEEHKAELGVAPPSTLTRLWNEMVQGYESVVESAVGLLAFFLRYGPSLLFWFLVLFWPARWMWRRLRAMAQ